MEVNNGRKTKIWLDRWIPGQDTPPQPINDFHRFYQDVEELILPNTNNWNVELTNQLFDINTSQKIHNSFLDTSKEEIMVWMPAKDGKFSVKSTYKKLTMNNSESLVNGRIIQNKVWKALWKRNTTHKIKLFAWRCIHDSHPTRHKLARYNDIIDSQCPICGNMEEAIEHLLFHYRHSRTVWRLVNVDIDEVKRNCEGIKGFYADGVLSPKTGECMVIREALIWSREKQLTRIHVEADANRDDNRVTDAIPRTVRETITNLNLLNNFSAEICSLLARDFNTSST
ncbi:uncharacterized protein LOC113315954 [Papaver somniferum]|uniref:uncharacterized protein LOC113315954 n=1 Tax=Papaver somniferum TaxID=3469 RepID=UPI000E6FF226|nr:uncharacterized protein LOC113315954 [Papaver somniferum]